MGNLVDAVYRLLPDLAAVGSRLVFEPFWRTEMGNDLTIADWIKPYLPIMGAVVRGLLQIASGLGFTWALTVSGDQIQMAVTAAAMLATLVWSAWQKIAAIKAARLAEVAAAKASAEATMKAGTPMPVTVTVTAKGLDNIATRVPATEAAAAPSVPVDVRPQPAPVTP
jgi:hypothetical protein